MDRFIDEANELVERKYRFNNPWDMECCDEPYQLVNGHAYYSPNGDPEWCYMFARLEFLRKFLLAYNDTKDKTYIEAYIQNVTQFYSENTIKNGQLKKSPITLFGKALRKCKTKIQAYMPNQKTRHATYRTLDTAIRNYTLLCDLYCFEVLNNNADYRSFLLERLSVDMPFTIEDLFEFDFYSNWGLIRLSLYISCKLMNGDNDIIAYLEPLKVMLNKQIRIDGGHIECSLMYHMQVLICLLRMLNQMHLAGIEDVDIEATTKEMALYAYHLSDSNNNQIMYGDSDYTNIDTVMAIAEGVLQLEYRLHIACPTDRMLLVEFQNLKFDESKPLLQKLNREWIGGTYVINETQYQIRFFNETTNSNHKHADNGSVVLYYKKKPVLIDTGRCTYHDDKMRKYYKGAFGHNVAVVDDGAEWDFQSKWRFTEHPNVIENKLAGDSIIAAYGFGKRKIEHKRILYVNKEAVVIVSLVACEGKHDLTTIWNISDGIDYKTIDDTLYFYADTDKLHMKWYPNSDVKSQGGRISYHYNEDRHTGLQIIVKTPFVNTGISIAVISDTDYTYEDNREEFTLVFKTGSIKIDKRSGLITKHTEFPA